jgi:tungstate transport system ATP-binding protein
MNPVLSLRDISYSRDANFTLRVDRLDLEEKAIYALSGPNGAGKSTLLRVLSLLVPPDRGSLRFTGQSIRWKRSHLTQLRQHITLVEQSPYLFDGSVNDNLAFGLRLRGVGGREQRDRIEHALDAVGLGGFENRKSNCLSGGETRRVALARALVLQPTLLLLDEPTANIDGQQLQSFEALLTDLPQKGLTVVFSTHDPHQSERVGSKVLAINNGQVGQTHQLVDSVRQGNMEYSPWLSPLKTLEI